MITSARQPGLEVPEEVEGMLAMTAADLGFAGDDPELSPDERLIKDLQEKFVTLKLGPNEIRNAVTLLRSAERLRSLLFDMDAIITMALTGTRSTADEFNILSDLIERTSARMKLADELNSYSFRRSG
jgi:hypothetical protein